MWHRLLLFTLIGLWFTTSARAQTGDLTPITPDNAAEVAPLLRLYGHDNRVNAVSFSQDGAWLVSGGDDAAVIVWSALTGEALPPVFEHYSFVKSAMFNPQDPAAFVTASWDYTVMVWSISDSGQARRSRTFQGFTAVVEPVVYSPDGALIAFGVGDGVVHVVNPETGETLLRHRLDALQVTALAFDAESARVIASGGFPSQTADMIDVASGEVVFQITHNGAITALAVSPDGALIASGGDDMTVRLWSADDGLPFASLQQDDWVTALAWSPDGGVLAVGLLDGSVWLWSAETEAELITLTLHDEPVTALAWSTDGARLASASEDRTLAIWGLAE